MTPRLPGGKRFACVLVLALFAAGCGDDTTSEQRFRETLAEMDRAAEDRELADFMDHVSEEYTDSQGRTWEDIRRLAQLHLLRNRNLHVYRHVTQLDLVEDESARAVVLVALAGSPVKDTAGPRQHARRADAIRGRVSVPG